MRKTKKKKVNPPLFDPLFRVRIVDNENRSRTLEKFYVKARNTTKANDKALSVIRLLKRSYPFQTGAYVERTDMRAF